jgi:dihydrofolate reductase
MTISMIVAADLANAIGHKNTIPWRSRKDMRNFQTLTLGKTVVMGRKTAESIGRALPGRKNVVLTSRDAAPYPEQTACRSLHQAVLAHDPNEELCIIGGAEVYRQALEAHLIDVLHFTRIQGLVDADAWLPEELGFTGGLVEMMALKATTVIHPQTKVKSVDTHDAVYYHVDRRVADGEQVTF